MSKEIKRRDFIGYSFAAVAAVGAGASLIAMKKTWDPLPSVLASGFTTIDLTPLKAGTPETFAWRGMPIFVLKKTEQMEKSQRDLVLGEARYTVAIGLCTHLGCIPSWKNDQWICACHAAIFDASGKQTFGPPPRPLDLPPFEVKENTLVLGNEGPQYQQIAEFLATQA